MRRSDPRENARCGRVMRVLHSNSELILSLLSRGVSLMKRIVASNASKKAIIIKKVIHCSVRLLKSEALQTQSTSLVEGCSLCVTILSLLEWPELQKDAIQTNDSRPSWSKKKQLAKSAQWWGGKNQRKLMFQPNQCHCTIAQLSSKLCARS